MRLFVFPDQSRPDHVDAIVVLAGAASERLPVGQQLYEEDIAHTLAISNAGGATNSYASDVCASTVDPDVICFAPEEDSTRGEARVIGRLAAKNRWASIIVVTSTYHLYRATTLVEQTTDVDVYGVASTPTMSVVDWAWHLVHETVGLVDVLLRPEDVGSPT